jgi:quinol monooxygenase YgiN
MPHHSMTGRILTEVAARVEGDREDELRSAFAELLTQPLPDGLLRTELLRGPDGTWRVQTLWRDREALDAMRASAEPPAAPTLFRLVGAQPVLVVFEVADGLPGGDGADRAERASG